MRSPVKIQMTEYGNNRPQVAVYSAGNPGPAEKECDPDAGEILDEETRGPIDLKSMRRRNEMLREKLLSYICRSWK